MSWRRDHTRGLVFLKETNKQKDHSSLFLLHVKTQWEDCYLQAKKKVLIHNQIGDSVILNVPASRTVKNKCPLFKAPSLWYWVIATCNRCNCKPPNSNAEALILEDLVFAGGAIHAPKKRPCEEIMRSWLSANQEEGSHQTPWAYTSQPEKLWEINVCCFRALVIGILLE